MKICSDHEEKHGQWQHFADCILRQSKPECTLEDGKRAVEIALAATESASTGRVVKWKE